MEVHNVWDLHYNQRVATPSAVPKTVLGAVGVGGDHVLRHVVAGSNLVLGPNLRQILVVENVMDHQQTHLNATETSVQVIFMICFGCT